MNFNFLRNLSNSSDSSESNPGAGQMITLAFNAETITIPASLAEGKTVQQLFDANAEALGTEPGREAVFVYEGQRVSGSSTVQPGGIYRGNVACESKGA